MKKHRIFVSDGFNLDGSRRRFSKTIETDLKGRDLEKFLTIKKYEFEEEVKKKDPKFHNLARGTFRVYSDWWLDYKKNHDNIAGKTHETYKKFLNDRILNYIGSKTLDKLTNGDMLELIETIKNSPTKTKTGRLSEKTVKHYHTLLKTMFNDAIKLKILDENPMENISVKAPRAKLKDNYYDLEDIRKLMELLPSESIRYQLATNLAITTGLRLGELTALQWKHIDLKRLEIKIEQANSHTTEGGTIIKSTKNEHSERTVAFPKLLIELFEQHRENEILKKELLGKEWEGSRDSEEDFIFTQETGKVIFIGTISKWFRMFIRKHNLKYITFHGLRHTNATILINEGVNLVSISHMLGHSNTSTTTNVYAHHLESVERKMADKFDDILKNKQDENESGTQCGTHEPKLRVVK